MVVGLLLRSVRVFKQFSWLGVGSVKVALSRPTHQRVTRVVGRLAPRIEGFRDGHSPWNGSTSC